MRDLRHFDFVGRELGPGINEYISITKGDAHKMVEYKLFPGCTIMDIKLTDYYYLDGIGHMNMPNAYRIGLILDGIYQSNMGDYEIQVSPDQIYLGHSYKQCDYAKTLTKRSRGISIQLIPDYFDPEYFKGEQTLEGICQELIANINKIVKNGTHTSDPQTLSLGSKLFDALDTMDLTTIRLTLMLFLHRLSKVNFLEFYEEYHAFDDGDFEEIKAIKDFIDNNLHMNLTINNITDKFSISMYKLNRAFKNFTGKSPGEYINMARLGKAQDLLIQDDMSVTEIGQALGYSSTSNFSRAFKRHTGKSPREFRKKLK